mgnify:CR=1 FL=1
MDQIVPHIEENIPLPKNAAEAFPELSPSEELTMRANVVKLMSDLTGKPLLPTQDNADQAKEIAREMITNPEHRPDFSKYPNETLAMLAGMVAQMNVSIVDELADFKLYVVNKLVLEIENAKDSKARIAAISKLGEVDGVDAFKKRTETTHIVKPIEEVEKELVTILDNIDYAVVEDDGEITDLLEQLPDEEESE